MYQLRGFETYETTRIAQADQSLDLVSIDLFFKLVVACAAFVFKKSKYFVADVPIKTILLRNSMDVSSPSRTPLIHKLHET